MFNERPTDIFCNFASDFSILVTNEPPVIQLLALCRPAADVVLRLLFLVCQDTGESHIRELPALPAGHGFGVVAACRQLFGAFLLRNQVQECRGGHPEQAVQGKCRLYSHAMEEKKGKMSGCSADWEIA